MKTAILFIAFVLLLSGCRTKTRIERSTEVVTESVQLDISTEKVTSTQSEIVETSVIQRDITTDMDETVTKTIWSAPDSAGQQFPTATIQINRTTRAQEAESVNVQRTENEQTKIVETIQDSSIIETNIETVTDIKIVREANRPLRHWLGGLLVLVAIAAVFKWFLKRKK